MHLRFFLSSVAFLATSVAFAEPPATNTPPGPVTIVNLNGVQPETPAPPQPNAKSAPGAAAPSGTPVTKAPNTSAPKTPNPNAAPVPVTAAAGKGAAPAAGAKKPASVLDNYLSDLNDALKLSADEKQEIETYYLADGATLDGILNNSSLSPLEQAQQVADLRDKRDAKIDALLVDAQRQHDFYEVEARYRVALTEFAADGGLVPAGSLPAMPQPSGVTPGQAEPKTGGL